jgi:cytochrome c
LETTLVDAFAIFSPRRWARERFDLMELTKSMHGSIRRSLLSVVLVLVAAAALAQDKRAQEGRGEGLLTSNCGRCHAVGRTGNSTHPQAPPFRTLGQRYPIEVLAEALAEGLSSGHPTCRNSASRSTTSTRSWRISNRSRRRPRAVRRSSRALSLVVRLFYRAAHRGGYFTHFQATSP